MKPGDIIEGTCYGSVELVKLIDADANLWYVRNESGYYSLQIQKEKI